MAALTDPKRKDMEWPPPTALLDETRRRGIKLKMSAERRQVAEEIHGFWYRMLSGVAHHRLSALQVAIYTEQQPDDESFERIRSMTAVLAVLVTACVLAEIEAAAETTPCAELRVAWGRLHNMDEITRSLYRDRYQKLLGLDVGPRPAA